MFDLPSTLEQLTKDDPVLSEDELESVLKNNCKTEKRDLYIVIELLLKFKLIRKVMLNKNQTYYLVGRKKDSKFEEFSIEKKKLGLMYEILKQKEDSLTREIYQLREDIKQAKIVKSPQLKLMMLTFTAKVKALKAMKGRLTIMNNRINQFNTAQDDIEMGKVLKDTNNVLEDGMQDSLDVIRDAINMGKEVDDMQNSLNDMLAENKTDKDIEDMFNKLDDDLKVPEDVKNNVENNLKDSGILDNIGIKLNK